MSPATSLTPVAATPPRANAAFEATLREAAAMAAKGNGPLQEVSRIYRGRTVEELIPKIQAELGADAVVLRREKGLTGGFAGFFQRPFVEIEARRGTPMIDRYDEDGGAPALPGDPREPAAGSLVDSDKANLQADDFGASHTVNHSGADHTAKHSGASHPADHSGVNHSANGFETSNTINRVEVNHKANGFEEFRELTPAHLMERAVARDGSVAPMPVWDDDPFAAALAEAEAAVLPAPLRTSPAATTTPSGRTRASIERALAEVGMSEEFVRELIDAAAAHVLPLMPGRPSLARAVHTALAQRIPSCAPLPAGNATIAVVGPGGAGKSACCAALLAAYRRRGTLPVTRATILLESHHPAKNALREAREQGVLLLDTPAVSPADGASIRALAALLAELRPDRVVLALPATLGCRPAAQLLEALAPLSANALAITHADETNQLGVAVQTACAFGIAPVHLLSRYQRGRASGALTPIDPTNLADRLLPPR
jgi:flagellar biosynthesis GTPase FlhF